MRCLIGTTLAPFKLENEYDWARWLADAEHCVEACRAAGVEVVWFAALQVDSRGRDVYDRLLGVLGELEAGWWWFSFDPGHGHWTSSNRLAAICTGRNLITHRALDGFDWIYYADSDVGFPPDTIPKLLELDHPVCGAHIPHYCLDGPRSDRPGDARWHRNSAGSLLVRRDVFVACPWRTDPDAGLTDDFATQELYERFGYETLVRHDVVCDHESLVPLEFRGHDRRIYR